MFISQRVGCDRVLGSTAVPDSCGVCKGDNSTCKIYKGQYTRQHYTNRRFTWLDETVLSALSSRHSIFYLKCL